MILLVPISPEVPKLHWPKLWPGLVMVLILGIIFLETDGIVEADSLYIESLQTYVIQDEGGRPQLKPEIQSFIKLRPLLRVAPSKGDWDLTRLFFANFLHGGTVHLILNLIGVFAGARICATFIPFLCTMSIFIVGGSLGLLASILVTSEVSAYVPHIGASAGIFALMGTYYVYNFSYRTKYFFWYPLRREGLIAMRTSWFFFVDVILLEIVLSAAQLLPNHLDSVDHVAHVIGFGSGMLLAYALRFIQRWPSFLQTRGEFIYWNMLKRPRDFDPVVTPFEKWLELLEINPYNDQLKLKLFRIVYKQSELLNDKHVAATFRHLTPTFIRLHTEEVSACLQQLLLRNRKLPDDWYVRTPYDSVIKISKYLAEPADLQHLLFKFVGDYRRAHPEGGDLERKLELLMRRLSGFMPQGATDAAERQRRASGG